MLQRFSLKPSSLRTLRGALLLLFCYATPLPGILLTSVLLASVSRAEDARQERAALSVYPSSASLTNAGDKQRLIVLETKPDGSIRDVSLIAAWSSSDSAIAVVDSQSVQPVGNGTCEIKVTVDGMSIVVPVTVQNSDVATPLSFRSDVMAVLTKAGCNTGKCHGSASGKDGFRLSLFGYDPNGDHCRLTREIPGRRISVRSPKDSLLINKALGNVDHTGGQLIIEDSPEHRTLLQWMEQGAPADPAEIPVPVSIRVLPEEVVFAQKGEAQSVLVMASFSDGTDRDVTDRAVFISNNDASATVTTSGSIQASGPGSAFIMARFDQFTAGTAIIVRPGTPYKSPELPSNNYVDDLVQDRWRDLHLIPSDVCSDEVFLRRVYVDLTGLLPTPDERTTFLADSDPKKREKVVDALLVRPEFPDLWVMKWAEMLQIRTINGISAKGLLLYDRWLRDRVHAGMTIDAIVRELIPATGGTFANPATSYYQTETTPQLLAENMAQAFLGTRIQCAQCHNHPFDRWTMDDYYGFAAFFSQVGYKQDQDPREIMIFNSGTGSLAHPVDNRSVIPTFLGEGAPEIPEGTDYREVLANWLTSDQNPAFARNLSNVVWAQFFGIGIVDPVDDVRVSNPPSNPRLLDSLAKRLQESHYDIRPLIRDICTSRVYQLSTARNESNRLDERHFSHGRVRRLRAEVMLDCLNQVTETSVDFRGLPAGSRAIQVPDGATPNYFLTTFGRASRATACSCEVKTSPTLSQALHLLNGESTTGKIAEGKVIERMLANKKEPAEIVSLLYELCLCRQPTEKEAQAIHDRLSASADVKTNLSDLFWALLNSNEFIFNH